MVTDDSRIVASVRNKLNTFIFVTRSLHRAESSFVSSLFPLFIVTDDRSLLNLYRILHKRVTMVLLIIIHLMRRGVQILAVLALLLVSIDKH